MQPYNFPVTFADTDAGGVVYHSRYLDIAERARSAWLQNLGFSNSQLLQDNTVFAVRRLAIEYLKPARLDDVLVVTTKIIEQRAASIRLEQQLSVNQTTMIEISLTLACLNTAGKPQRIPDKLRIKLED